jgi:hypothetical protein
MAILNPIIVNVPRNSANPLDPILVNVVKGTISPTVRTLSYGGGGNSNVINAAFQQANSAYALAQSAYRQANTTTHLPGTNNDVLYNEDGQIAANNYFNYDPETEILHVTTIDATIDAGTF